MIQTPPLDYLQRWRMAFDLRRPFTIEVAGIATIILSLALPAYFLYSIW